MRRVNVYNRTSDNQNATTKNNTNYNVSKSNPPSSPPVHKKLSSNRHHVSSSSGVRVQYRMPFHQNSSQMRLAMFIGFILIFFFVLSSSDTAFVIFQSLSSSSNHPDYYPETTPVNKRKLKPTTSETLPATAAKLSPEEESKLLASLPACKLSNGAYFPLVGIGCGNTPHKKIPMVVATMLSYSARGGGGGIAYIDIVSPDTYQTANSDKNNEALVSRAISYFSRERVKANNIKSHASEALLRGPHHHPPHHHKNKEKQEDASANNNDPKKSAYNYKERLEIHVVTKVSYSSLGYENTKLALQNSLAELLPALSQQRNPTEHTAAEESDSSNVDVRVHALLYSPRCNPTIPWISCPSPEEQVPNLDFMSTDAWKGSWKALEEFYKEGKLHSIGISNFNLEDIKALLSSTTIPPHFYQGSVFTAVLDLPLMEFLKKHDVHYQAYNVMQGVVQRKHVAPLAYEVLENIAFWLHKYDHHADVKKKDQNDLDHMDTYSVARLVLAWLVQRGISVVPKAISADHLADNAPASIAEISKLSTLQDFEIETAVSSLLRGKDVQATHHNLEKQLSQSNLERRILVTFRNRYPFKVMIMTKDNDLESPVVVMDQELFESGATIKFIAYLGNLLIVYKKDGTEIIQFPLPETLDSQEYVIETNTT